MFALALLMIAMLVVWAATGHGRAVADTPNRAGLVVTFSDGYTVSKCVEFAETEISGAELLERIGLPVVSSGGSAMGAAVCKIGDEGCDNPNDCFCRCQGADCQYWAYYTLEDGQWKYSGVGASVRKIHAGDVDGWAWGAGKVGEGAAPQPRTFQEICPPLTTPPPPQPPPPTIEADAPPAVESPVVEATQTADPATSPQPSAGEPTSQPVVAQVLPAQAASEEAQPKTAEEEDEGSGFPAQLIVFAGLAVALTAAAVVLARRRARG